MIDAGERCNIEYLGRYWPTTQPIRLEGDPDQLARFVMALQAARRQNEPMDDPAVSVPATEPTAPARAPVTIDEAFARWTDALTGDGRSPMTIHVYRRNVERAARAAGWRTPYQMSYADAMAYLAARRRADGGGRKWGTNACHQCISALRSFGDYAKVSGLLTNNPFADLRLPKRGNEQGKHPLAVHEARKLLEKSIERHNADMRAAGCAPLVWFCMMCTGLRHSEVKSMRWGDVCLDDEDQGIWTSPDWIGNKAKSRDWLPLHPTLAGLLARHRLTVPDGDQAAVFPIVPSRGAFRTDRQAAGLPAVTPQRRTISPHSCRASFASWLANAGVSDSIISRLMRHSGSLAERVYVVRDAEIAARELRAAVLLLPSIWPEMGLRLEQNGGIFPQGPCTSRPMEYIGSSQAGSPEPRTAPQPPHRPENLEAGSGRALGGPGSHVGEPEPPTAKIEPQTQVCGAKIPDGDLESLTRVLVRLADLWLARASGNGGPRAQPTEPSGPEPQRH